MPVPLRADLEAQHLRGAARVEQAGRPTLTRHVSWAARLGDKFCSVASRLHPTNVDIHELAGRKSVECRPPDHLSFG
jgi:hypothetical protein